MRLRAVKLSAFSSSLFRVVVPRAPDAIGKVQLVCVAVVGKVRKHVGKVLLFQAVILSGACALGGFLSEQGCVILHDSFACFLVISVVTFGIG